MLPSLTLIVPVLFLLVIGGISEVNTKNKLAKSNESLRGKGDYSQQYHYSSYDSGQNNNMNMMDMSMMGSSVGKPALAIDLNTGIFLALAAIIVLLVISIFPLLGGKSCGSDESGSGWDRKDKTSYVPTYRSYSIAGAAERILSALEKVYDAYNG